MATCWTGQSVKCRECGSENTTYVTDVEHGGGACEVFKCECGASIHIELPD